MLTRQDILSSQTPLVFKNVLTWEHRKWSINRWKTMLGAKGSKYPIRKGFHYCSELPLWENKCETTHMTMDEFFSEFNSKNETDSWLYFDYKHISQWFSETLKDITWECVGFPERKAEDSTLWIGTEGAHTPCHMDAYGCNLVAQIYGKKMWLLFDPSESFYLSPTRVPYEESSIYSNINFSCTRSRSRFPEINNVLCVILEPGDVLYVPNNWWHYVEHVTSAISINTWIPVKSDDDSRISESLVKFFMSTVVHKLDLNQVDSILNPNERDISGINTSQCLKELNICLQRKKYKKKNNTDDGYLKYFDYTPEVKSLKYVMGIIQKNCERSTPFIVEQKETATVNHLINAFCHPDTVSLVKKILENQLKID